MRSHRGVEVRCISRLWAVCVALLLATPLVSVAQDAQDSSVAKLIEQLKSSDLEQREAAIDALGQLGPAAASATLELAAELEDKSEIIRAHAAHALMQIGPEAAAAAPALAKAMSDPDYHVRRMSVAALEKIHPDPSVVVKALGKALADADPSVRVAALHTLTEYSKDAVPVLSEALENENTRYWSALALGELGPEAKAAVPALAKALSDERPTVQRELLIALARIGPDSAPAVPAIIPLLQSKDDTVAHAAGFALGSIGPGAASATEALKKSMDGKDQMEECVNCWALARIEPKNEAAREHALAMLFETVKDKNPRVQSAAIRGLMDLRAPAGPLVAALEHVVLNGEEPAVSEALGALTMMGDAAAEVLDDALMRPETRGRAALLIAYMGPKAKSTVPALAKALDDKDPDVRREVLFALAAIGPDAALATPAIVGDLSDPNIPNRAVAAFALGKIGPAAKEALPKLQEELRSSDPLVRGGQCVCPGEHRSAKPAHRGGFDSGAGARTRKSGRGRSPRCCRSAGSDRQAGSRGLRSSAQSGHDRRRRIRACRSAQGAGKDGRRRRFARPGQADSAAVGAGCQLYSCRRFTGAAGRGERFACPTWLRAAARNLPRQSWAHFCPVAYT